MSANCIAPFLVSCDGSGTSRRGFPVIEREGPSEVLVTVGVREAGFADEEEIKADWMAGRSGKERRVVDGLAGELRES